MNIGLLTFQIVIPHAQSLKDKRQVIQSLRGRLKKFNISFAECGHQNLWQRSTLGIVAISSSHLILNKTLQSIENEIENTLNGDLIHTQVEYL